MLAHKSVKWSCRYGSTESCKNRINKIGKTYATVFGATTFRLTTNGLMTVHLLSIKRTNSQINLKVHSPIRHNNGLKWKIQGPKWHSECTKWHINGPKRYWCLKMSLRWPKSHFDGPKMTQCLWNLRSHGLNWPLVRYLTVGTARVPNDIWSWYNVLTNVTYVKQNWALLKSTFEDINVPKTFIFIDTVGAGIEVLRLRLTNKLTRFSTSIVYFQLIINRPR